QQTVMLHDAHTVKRVGAAAAVPGLGAAAVQVEPPILVEGRAVPDVADARLPDIWKKFRGPEGDVLPAERDATERVHIQPLKGPDARLLALRRQARVKLFVESLFGRDPRVVVPGEELSRDHFIDADPLQPEIDRALELPLRRRLPDDRDHHARRGPVRFAELEGRSDVVDVTFPPRLGIARSAPSRRTQTPIRLRVARVHGELDQICARGDDALELLALRGPGPGPA